MKLIDLSYINTKSGRPSPRMTNETWQEVFEAMQMIIKPTKQKKIIETISKTNLDSYLNTYHGETINQTRAKVLNDNLKQIRSGNDDYVYFIYNISELLKYEHDKLRTYYNQKEQYFKIWLEE